MMGFGGFGFISQCSNAKKHDGYLLLLMVFFGFASFAGLWAQTDALAPKPVPREEGPQPAKPGENIPEAFGDKTIILNKLEGLVIYGDPGIVQAEGYGDSKSVQDADHVLIMSLEPPAAAEFLAIATKRIGQPVSIFELNSMLREMIVHYRLHDRPVVDAFMPEQAVRNGIIQVVITESKVSEIRVEGNRYFKEPIYRSGITLHPGDPVSTAQITANQDWLSLNPFRRTEVVYEKGIEPGTTDLIIKTTERRPFRGYISIDDTGNDLTGDLRYAAGYSWGNVFGWDQQLNYQFITSPDFNMLKAHSLSYIIPLPWHHTLSFIGSYGNTVPQFDPNDGAVGANLNSKGYSWQTGLRYGIPLIPLGDYKHNFTVGYDFKQSTSQILANVVNLSNTSTDVSQFNIAYDGSYPDEWGSTNFSILGVYSPGGMTSNNDDAEFVKANARGAGYAYTLVNVERITKLPLDFTLSTRGTMQFSNKHLIGSEQLGMGGWNTVRGYDEREANGDQGYFGSIEIRTPPVSVGEPLGFTKSVDKLQYLLFFDYASLHVDDGETGAVDPGPDFTLMSVGPGLRYSINPYFSARFDYGWQLSDTGVTEVTRRDYNSRGHFSITLSY